MISCGLHHPWSNPLHTAENTPDVTPVASPDPNAMLPAATLKDLVLTSLDEDKAEEVLCVDLAGKSSIADIMVIASGRSQRHVAALADHILRKIKDAGHGKARVEGLPNADWVLIDTGDLIVHLFRPEVRSFYAIERIWADGGTRHAAGAA